MKKSNLIIRIIKAVADALRGLKIKSKCCNSECNKTIHSPVPVGQAPQEQGYKA